ncbi:MAG: magnesium/cobalt transporter CorA [Proteobacteria bacterium]|nr:magnesium/cobalt transporter CorA [Pseudomonadota bacterium]
MFSEIKIRTLKANQPPGTLVYTGDNKNLLPNLRLVRYSTEGCEQKTGAKLPEVMLQPKAGAVTWLQVQGLQDIDLMEQLAQQYGLHPLTMEDILNVGQRPKIEEFEDYIFITLKVLQSKPKQQTFVAKNLSLVMGKDFILTFDDEHSDIFDSISERICRHPDQWLKRGNNDYLTYRLIDTIVDGYFFVLEKISDRLEKIEDLIISNPTKRNARSIYQLKKQIFQIRKMIWPLREILSHLLNAEKILISDSTKIYLRDVLDHANQAMDAVETFRDMLSNMLDVYLSNLSYRMNEIMKVLTIIATIFMPITFISSIYGMNFHYMPELSWRWAYPAVLGLMVVIVLWMLQYYRRKKWL